MLSPPVILERLKEISRWNFQVVKHFGPVQLRKLAQGWAFDIHPALDPLSLKQGLGFAALEGLDGHVTQ